jgi:O-antigen ligase
LLPFRSRLAVVTRKTSDIYSDYTDFILFLVDVFLLAVLIFWLLSRWSARQRPDLDPQVLSLPLIVFTLFCALISIFALDAALSFYHVLRLALLANFAFYIWNVHLGWKAFLPAFGLQIALQSPVALLQFIYQSDLGLQKLGEYSLNPAWEGVAIVSVQGERWLRGYGLSDHPNILGGSLAFSLILLAAGYFSPDGKKRFWIPPVFGLGIAGLMATFSRSAMLALFVGGLLLTIFVIWQQRGHALKRGLVLLAVTGLAVVPFLMAYPQVLASRVPGANETMEGPELQSIGERILLNEAGVSVFLQQPITGVGLGNLPAAMRLSFPEFSTYYQPSHFVLISAVAEVGLIGASIYAILLLLPFIALLLIPDNQRTLPLVAASAGLLAVAIIGLLDYYPWLLVPGRIWQYLLWGFWGVAFLERKAGNHE